VEMLDTSLVVFLFVCFVFGSNTYREVLLIFRAFCSSSHLPG
jgi:hypothetical protein